jgi:hypothetical protein
MIGEKIKPIARLRLGEYWDNCPLSWQNYIIHLQDQYSRDSNTGIASEEIKINLKKFKAEYIENDDKTANLYFYDESRYTLFLLKYGT